MLFEGHSFDDVAGLVAAARSSLRHGRFVAIGRDGDQPALLWLDRLALWRYDWHDTIAAAFAALLCDADAEVRAAAVDALDRGAATPALLPELEVVADADAATSDAPLHFRRDAAPLRLADVLDRARPQRQRLSARPALVVVRAPKVEVVRIGGRDDVLALARRAAAAGGSLTGGGPGGHHALDWLRTLALFAPWARQLVPEVLAALFEGDLAERRAALEYTLRCGDRRDIAAVVVAAVAADPDFAAMALASPPLSLALAPAPTVASLASYLAAQATAEAVSAPIHRAVVA